jgi:hypothetical protein
MKEKKMKRNWLEKVVVGICIAALTLMLGCGAFLNAVTPCFIEPEIIADVNDSGTSFMPFTSLWDAQRLINKLDYLYQLNQINLARQIENEKLRYEYLRGLQSVHIQDSQEFQATIFSPEGVVGILLPAALGTTVGAFLLNTPKKKEG